MADVILLHRMRGGEMTKYCPICGIEYPEEELFCRVCNTPLSEKPLPVTETVVNTESPNPYFHQFIEDEKHHRKSKTLIVISVIAVIAILIGASFWILFSNNGTNPEVTKYYLRNDGPKLNLQSSVTGSVSLIPDQGYFATYGYYYQDNRIGAATIERAGEETYQGKQCFKTKTTGDMDMLIANSQVKCTFEALEYHTIEDNMLFYISTTYQYSMPSQFTQSANYQWDQENNKMTYTISSAGEPTTVVCSLPDKYWELASFLGGNLQVGYSDELNYTMDMDYLELPINVTMIISVTGQEDVSVPNGDYKDCYVIEIHQTYQLLGSEYSQTFTFWVDSQGVMPKAETTSSSAAGGTVTILMKLDEYYTTVAPENSEPV